MEWVQLLGKRALLFRVVDKLCEKAVEFSLSLAHSEAQLVLGVESELDKLRRTVARIHALLNDAEERRHIVGESVKHWLGELKDVALDADDLLDEVEATLYLSKRPPPENPASTTRKRKRVWYCASFISPPSPLILFKRRVAKEIVVIRERFDHIAEDRKKLRLGSREATTRDQARDPPRTASFQEQSRVLGRDGDRDKIVTLLLNGGKPRGDDKLPVIPIHGMGGIGKTTLARSVFDDERVVEHFKEKRMWVCVTKGFDAARITPGILESLTNENCNFLNPDVPRRRLREMLLGQRFLLVLDNVADDGPLYWEELRACLTATGEDGSRVLITTRSAEVARRMGTVQSERLLGIPKEDCLSLFKQRAFPHGEFDEHPSLVEVGREIVGKCQGSPLAAMSLGGLLYFETDEDEWWSVLREMPEFSQNSNDILRTLNVSYEHLPLHLKKCFQYCGTFPDGYEFDKEELVKLWMAQGFIESRGRRRLEIIGGKYFDDLLWRSFFQVYSGDQNQKLKYKMPCLIHDLAKFVSKHECLIMENSVPQPQDVPKRVHHSSLFCRNGEAITFTNLYRHESLRTFLLCGESRVDIEKVPQDLFLQLRCLRVLDLSNSGIIYLPDSIGQLKHLRYLSLYNTWLERLPESVSSLCNLQTLELGECYRLLELPEGTSNLINLRHLGLHLDQYRRAHLISMPPGIGQLTSLQTLSRFTVGTKSECGIGELRNLNLRGELCISKLENVLSSEDARYANLEDKQHIHTLMLQWGNKNQFDVQNGDGLDVIECFQPQRQLKHLWIDNYNGATLPSWIKDTSFSSLVTLRLSYCKRWKFLPSLGQQPQLKSLYVEGMHRVRSMDQMFLGDDKSLRFPSLEKLTLWDMPQLVSCTLLEGEMPCLSEFYISCCPKLRELPHLPPALRKLVMKDCLELAMLPLIPSLHNLIIKRCHWMTVNQVANITSLSSLTISQIPALKTIPKGILQPLTLLKRLEIGGCKKLVSVAGNGGLQDLISLEHLQISSCPNLASTSNEGLPATLRDFRLYNCSKLSSLPKGLHTLASLQHMEIHGLPGIISLPEAGMPTAIKYLAISGCSSLAQRCQKVIGQDWPKIQHIRFVEIDSKQISPS